MNFARFFIDRPVFAAVISIVTVIVGSLAAVNLPIAQFPQIAPPTIVVSATYPGANAQTVAATVASPIEQQVNGVERMLYMSSQSGNDGTMRLTVTFEVGTDLDTAQVQVQNRVALAEPVLPAEVRQTGVVVRRASPDITLVVQLNSPDNSRDTLFLSNYASLQVRDRLARLPGVGDITLFGARDYSIRVWLDPNKMVSRDMTAGDVVNAIREQNLSVAGGVVGAPPYAPTDPNPPQFQLSVNTRGRLIDPKEFGSIVIRTGADGRLIRIQDVARVELGAADYGGGTYGNGRPAVGMAVFQLPGSNAIQTSNAVRKAMEEMAPNFPPGVGWAAPYDTTLFVRESLQDVARTLIEAVLLVVLVVLVFLQGWRATIIPLLAVPVSIIGTCAVLWALNFSLNTLTLFGMVLAIGIVVDDAIVVVENIERWIEHGLTPREAAYKAMDEVTGAVIAIALGLSAVFIPVAFIGGITGQFYRQFALTIAVSTLLSAVNSLTLSPALGALLLRPRDRARDWLTRGIDFLLGWLFRGFNRGLNAVTNGYARVLRGVVRASVVALLVYVGLLFVTYLGFRNVPAGFIPSTDTGYLLVNLQLPNAAALHRSDRVIQEMAATAARDPAVQDTFAVAGYSIVNGASQSNAGAIFLILKPFDVRAGKPELSGLAAVKRLTAEYAKLREGTALVLPPPPVRGIGNQGGFTFELQDRTGTAPPAELQATALQLMAAAAKEPTLQNVFTTFRADVPQLFVEIDRIKAKQQAVAVADAFQTMQVFLGSLYVNDFNFLGRTYRVIAQADAPFRRRAEDVKRLYTRNAAGGMVPIAAIADVRDTVGPDRIVRFNLYPAAELNGAAAPGVSTGQALATMERLAADLPQGYGFEWTGIAFQEQQAGGSALFIFPLCVLFVWLTHAAEYESFALSTAIILIVPMCLLFGIGGVWLRGMDNNIFTQIGFVVLAGLSAKNAVLIVEFAQQQEHQGKRPFEAAVEASRLRLRPILMTSFAFLLGVLPLLRAQGAGAEMRQALGTAVFFGMLGVTIFGLFLTPVFYYSIRTFTGWFGRRPDREGEAAARQGEAPAEPH